MKTSKKILSIVLAVMLLVGTIVVGVSADTTMVYEKAGSKLVYTAEASKAANADGVIELEPGETITVSIYAQANYYLGTTGSEIFCWTAGFFNTFTEANVTLHNYVNQYTPNKKVIASTAANQLGTGYNKGTHEGYLYGRKYNTDYTSPYDASTPTLGYTFTFTVPETAAIGATGEFRMPETCSATVATTSRQIAIYAAVNNSDSAYGSSSLGSLYPETIDLTGTILNFKVVSAEAPEVPCDYTELEEALNLEPEYSEDYYDADAWAAYQDALEAADAIDRDMIVDEAGENQAKIDAAAKALKDAFNALGEPKVVDRSALEAALALTPEYDEEYYDEDTWAAWEEAVTAGRDTYDGVEGEADTEEFRNEVAAAAQAINDAFAALELKAADYSAVEAAKNAAAVIDADKYTEASVKAVNDAVAAVVEGYDITKQAEVDAMAKAINDAIAALVELGKCDYTALDAAIAAYEAKKADSYKYSNWAGYEAAYTAAKAVARDMIDDEDGVNQTIINDAEEALTNYVLKEKVLDYTAWNAAEAKVPASTDAYTPNSVAAFTAAKDAAVAAKADAAAAYDQAALDKAAADLEDAIALLKAQADKAALNAAIARATALNADAYTPDSWAAADLANVLAAANAVNADDNAAQDAVDAQVAAIEAAEAKLVKKADKSALTAAIEAAKALDEDDYTPDSWTAADLAAAIEAAEAVNNNANATDTEVADAIAALEEAAAKLAEKADKTALKAAIDTLPDVAEDEAVSATWEAYEDALADANAVYANANATQDDVNAAEANLLAAISAVKALGECDYTALYDAIDTTPDYSEEYYDAEAWAAYEAAKTAAEAVEPDMLDDEAGVNQAKIDAAAKALTDAFNALGEPKFVDRTALEEALALTPEYGEEYYDEDTWAAWEEAVAAGFDAYEGVDGEPDVEWARNEVAEAAKAINDAFAALELKAADYSAVDAAIEAAAAIDADKYTEASVKAVIDAVAAVRRGLYIQQQAEVDAMAKAINDAIAALVELGNCDYTALDAAIADYEAKVADKDLYTNWADYEAAYNAAKAVARDMIADEAGANQKAIDDAAAALNAIVLTYKDADYSAVEAMKGKIPADLSTYTDASVKALNDAVAAVVEGLDITKQAEVDAMAKAIEDAIGNLQKKGADYSALEAAIARKDALNANHWTAETWADVVDAYTAATGIAKDLTIDDQATIDAAAKALNDAIDALEEAPRDAVVTKVTAKQEYFKVGDTVEFDFLCSVTGVTKLQIVYSSGTTSTYTRTHSSVTKITDNGDGTETWTIAVKIIADTTPAKAKAKLGKVWEKEGYPFVFQTKQNPATLEDKEIKSAEVINANGDVVTEFKAKETVTLKIVAGPDTLRIRFVSEGGSTSTYTRTSAYQNADGNWVWEIKTSKTTLKTYKFDLYTAGKNNKLSDEGTDLVYTVVSATSPAGPSTGNAADIVVFATVAKARLLVGDKQTVTVVTDKDALGVRIVDADGDVHYQTKDTSVAVDNGDGTLTWTFDISCTYAATYTFNVEALYSNQWMNNGTTITYRVVY